MQQLMITGSGKIGRMMACLLADCGDYEIHLVDLDCSFPDMIRLLHAIPSIRTAVLDVRDQVAMVQYIQQHQIAAIISGLPYYLNSFVAETAKQTGIHYFDLTEDVAVTLLIKELAINAKQAFVPQCGLAPGFINIVANSLIQTMDVCKEAMLRVGALPQRNNHALHYSLTWSTDGLINEYSNDCDGLEQGRKVSLKALEGLESIQLDGAEYEAFNTSGGLGHLADHYQGRIQSLNYKTIRYPGHCEKMRFLMHELGLNEDKPLLKKILERALPKTYQDIVLIYVTVEGLQQNVLIEKSYFKKIYPAVIHGIEWAAIQISTASSICAVVDIVLNRPADFHGFISQEHFQLDDILANRFGHYYT